MRCFNRLCFFAATSLAVILLAGSPSFADPEDPPITEPLPEDPPAEDPPAEDPPVADPLPEDPPAQDPPPSDPLPIDPTLNPSGGPGGGATPGASPADQDFWWNVFVPMLQGMFPDATYEELCMVAEMWFNLLPPDAGA